MSTISECVLCGSKSKGKAKVEGAVVNVCDKCAKFGQAIHDVEYRVPVRRTMELEGSDQVLVQDFHKVVRRAREKRKLTQEELAKKLSEKHSVIKRIEEGWKPPMKLVEKVERFFSIKLKEEIVERLVEKAVNSKKLTIGDIVDIG
ncbi:MAG: multiprotein-bridging factor 1 family protein [Candidatus Aenigmatarchaeota archaeon]